MTRMNRKDEYGVLVLYYIGRGLYYVHMLYFLRFLSSNKEELYRGIHNAIFLFSGVNLSTSVTYYFADFCEDPKKKSTFFGWMFLATTLWYMLFVGGFFCLDHFLESFSKPGFYRVYNYLLLIIFHGYLVSLSILLKAWSVVLGRIFWPNFLQHIVLKLFTILILYLYMCYGFSFEVLILLMLAPYCLHLLLMVGYLYWLGELRLHLNMKILPDGFIGSFITYNLFIVVLSDCVLTLLRVCTWMVTKGLPAERLLYLRISTLVSLIDIPVKLSRQTIAPLMARLLKKQDHLMVGRLYRKQLFKQICVAGATFFVLYMNLYFILDLFGYSFSPEQKAKAAIIFLLYGLVKVFYNLSSISMTLLMLSEYFRYGMVHVVIFLLGCFLCKWLSVHYGLYALLGGLLATVAAMTVVTMGLLWHKLKVHPFSSSILLGLSIILLGVGEALYRMLP